MMKCMVSLDYVLDVVKSTAGKAVDADAPLMESGVDSLGATELRNQLQRAAADGVALSSTLMFDHPTARQLALHLQGRPSPPVSPCLKANTPACVPTCPELIRTAEVEVAGLSIMLPVGVDTLEALRGTSQCGNDLLRQIPTARWDIKQARCPIYPSPPSPSLMPPPSPSAFRLIMSSGLRLPIY